MLKMLKISSKNCIKKLSNLSLHDNEIKNEKKNIDIDYYRKTKNEDTVDEMM